jgi:hypothetical protein
VHWLELSCRESIPNIKIANHAGTRNTAWCVPVSVALFFLIWYGFGDRMPVMPESLRATKIYANGVKPFTLLETRDEMAKLLESEGFRVGAEVGVQHGTFAQTTLSHWPSCERYYLIDVWAQQTKYVDQANLDNSTQDENFAAAKNSVQQWANKTTFMRMRSDQAALKILDSLLDYVYVDARHDYCGAKQDITLFWPKLGRGGIMSGHDYLVAADVAPAQDWSLCENGERNPRAVKGAVDEFAAARQLQLVVSYQDGSYGSWFLRKP